MNYEETISYLFVRLPLFQQQGQAAYKEGLENTHLLDARLGKPHRCYRTIHVAGTNGKGSCAHTLARVLECAGYRVGLYTSPHLTDFRERIQINGEYISEEWVVEFVRRERDFFEPLQASFFEVTTAMAFRYFADCGVDIAVIEVGLGGRLDCTNVITPLLSVITNISLDHTALLGNTPAAIATEKAGIIKQHVPVLIGEATPETRSVFQTKAAEMHAPIEFAEDERLLIDCTHLPKESVLSYRALSPFAPDPSRLHYRDNPYLSQQQTPFESISFLGNLCGGYQEHNTETVLHALRILARQGLSLSDDALRQGFADVRLRGRWQRVGSLSNGCPLYCDTAHNPAGIAYVVHELKALNAQRLHLVIGMVNDKDVRSILRLFPTGERVKYYFTQPSIPRALACETLQSWAAECGLLGSAHENLRQALQKVRAANDDAVFVGGSTFMVADLLTYGDYLNLD